MTKDELIRAIRESPLTEEDFQDVLAALLETIVGNMFVAQGMDLSSGARPAQSAGRWVPAPECGGPNHESLEGWRGSGSGHEHWVAA